ncbi:hypothetical protein BDZ89DRAFT_1071091 [Hymenopellis radicata]|nr:hypothetical protein BDZ89DRAFT_1071091 [Hymenopellis radicata]
MPHINALIRATCAPDLFFSANEILWTVTARQVGRMHQMEDKAREGFLDTELWDTPRPEWASATAITSQLPGETFPGHLRVLCSQDAVCHSAMYVRLQTLSRSTSKARICGP